MHLRALETDARKRTRAFKQSCFADAADDDDEDDGNDDGDDDGDDGDDADDYYDADNDGLLMI